MVHHDMYANTAEFPAMRLLSDNNVVPKPPLLWDSMGQLVTPKPPWHPTDSAPTKRVGENRQEPEFHEDHPNGSGRVLWHNMAQPTSTGHKEAVLVLVISSAANELWCSSEARENE